MERNKVNIQLYSADCFKLLSSVESDSVDLVLIDPPYAISRPSGFSSVVSGVERFAVNLEFGEWDNQEIDGFDLLIKEAYRVLKKGGTFICFYDLWKISYLKDHMDSAKFKQIRFIEWLKTNPVPLNSKVNYLTNSREIALLGVKGGKPTFNSSYDNGIYNYPICHEKGRFHPTQKPLPLIRELIEKHSNEGDLVLDCFSGSGTTAAASMISNRNFIGCELSEEFYHKSIERLHRENNKLQNERVIAGGVLNDSEKHA